MPVDDLRARRPHRVAPGGRTFDAPARAVDQHVIEVAHEPAGPVAHRLGDDEADEGFEQLITRGMGNVDRVAPDRGRPGFAARSEPRHLHQADGARIAARVVELDDLTPRERLIAAFDMPASTPLCPYIAAAVELHDPQHPASQYARAYKVAIAARLTESAREAGATNPEQLGEQLALLLDGVSARTRVLNSGSFPTAAAIAAVLIDSAIPSPSPQQPSDDRGTTGFAVQLAPAGPGQEEWQVLAGLRAGTWLRTPATTRSMPAVK